MIRLGSVRSYWNRQGTVLAATTEAEDLNVMEPNIIYEGSAQILSGTVFKMWFSSGWSSPNINYAESLDGLTWTKYNGNPIIVGHNRSCIVKHSGTYYLYTAPAANLSIDLYTSTDGVNFTLDTPSALAVGGVGLWDHGCMTNSAVWVEGSNDWKMLYEAFRTGVPFKLGLATSSNGRTWTKYSNNPVLSAPGSRTGPTIYVKAPGSDYWIWTGSTIGSGGATGDILRHHSSNLIDWEQDPTNPVLARQGADEGEGAEFGGAVDPFILEVNGSTYLYYVGTPNGAIQSAGQHIKLAINRAPILAVINAGQ